MKNGLVIADAGPIFSLAVIDKLEILKHLFEEINISNAVWEEITRNKEIEYYDRIKSFFKNKVLHIKGFNELTFLMDYGESESVILYKELNANFLLIDDKKARKIAENFDIVCIGTLGILSVAKDKDIIRELRPLFKTFIRNNRYYSIELLNKLLEKHNEPSLRKEDLDN
jgi:predicted nucleic acid-binding protein